MPPVPLRNALDIAGLCAEDPCEATFALGSFWLGSRTSFESRLVKVFKECKPIENFEPHISALCRFYANLALQCLATRHLERATRQAERKARHSERITRHSERSEESSFPRIDWVVRVLGSGEQEADRQRPLSLLADMLCSMTGARNATDAFFKSQARPPMRVVDRLAGPEALKARLQYLAQDLFVRPCELPGSVLLLDDICNTGASTRVYAQALKQLTGADRVWAVNLAATRFARGKDGRGMLQLDLSGLAGTPSLCEVWVDAAGRFHLSRDCPAIERPVSTDVRFMAERTAAPCLDCAAQPPARRWWKFW